MKVEVTYWIEGYNTLEYELSEEDLEDYINWCQKENLDIKDKYSLLTFLDESIDFEEDINIKNSAIEHTKGTKEIINKCLNKIHEGR